MRTTWTVGFALMYLAGQFISYTLEQQYLGTDTTSIFYQILQPQFLEGGSILENIWGVFKITFVWIQALWSMFWWEYSFLTGTWAVLRYIGWSLSIGMAVAIAMAIRGVGSN